MIPRRWRWLVTDLDTVTTTFLDRAASERKATYILNDAAVAEMVVPSDHPNVRNIYDDGDPVVNEQNRLIYGFRREAQDEDVPYVCRFAGKISICEDAGDANLGHTHITAHDPWEILNRRPILDAAGHIPTNGITFRDAAMNDIAVDLIARTHLEHGTTRIDFGQGGVVYNGTLETLDEVDIHFDPGTSVGEGLRQLADLGCDIVLDPIYEPFVRPGYCSELSVYELSGAVRPAAVFGWDRFPRSLANLGRLTDGTQMANKLVAYTQDGKPSAIKTNAASVAKYGEYWLEKFFSNTYPLSVINALAQTELRIRAKGNLTLTLDPAPERSPDPFLEFFVGDSVPVYASDRLRKPLTLTNDETTRMRIQALPILMSDDGVESIDKLLLSFPLDDS